MSLKNLYLANNAMSALEMYEYRKLYHDSVMALGNEKKLDLWYDAPHYGKVNLRGQPIFLSESNLKQLDSEGSDTLMALDFVADAFDDLQHYFQKALSTNRIKSTGILSNIKAKSAWVNVSKLHHIHMDSLYKSYTFSYLRDIGENKVKTFDDFLVNFLNFIEFSSAILPVTRTSFIRSSFCTPMITGLMIEISDEDRSDDYLKQTHVLEDENYLFYVNALKRFGFFIDKNVPSRLVADVMSKSMIKYMQTYGMTSEKLFSSYFYRSLDYDIEILMNYLVQMWNSYATMNSLVKEIKEDCTGRKLLSKISHREKVDLQSLHEQYDFSFWVGYYFQLRLKEENIFLDRDDLERKLETLKRIVEKTDGKIVYQFIENEINNI